MDKTPQGGEKGTKLAKIRQKWICALTKPFLFISSFISSFPIHLLDRRAIFLRFCLPQFFLILFRQNRIKKMWPSSFVGLSMLSIFLLPVIIEAVARPSRHFGAPCQLCECFVEYTDRDINPATVPYKMVNNSYEATEDRCLAQCQNEQQCKLVVYGYVGGRDVFTCELYANVNMKLPLYTPFTNVYIKRGNGECRKSALGYEPLETMDPDERVTNRKQRYLRLYQKFNFFGFG